MASSGSVESGGYQGRCLLFEWGTNSVSADTNTRTIWYKVTAVGGTSSWYVHRNNTVEVCGNLVYEGPSYDEVWEDTVLAEGTMNINQSTNPTLTVDMHGGIYYNSDNIDTYEEWTLDEIPRYAHITSLSVKSRTINSITYQFTTDRSASLYVKNDTDGTSWLNNGQPFVSNTTSGQFTIYYANVQNTVRLTPNKTYKFIIKCKATVSGLDTFEETTEKTYDIGRLTSVPNFNHGDSFTIQTSNPSGSSLKLEMKVSSTQIFNKTVSTGSNTITLTDSELDQIYRLYGSSNSNTATFNLVTDNNSSYKDTKTSTITLTGKQKTAHVTQGRTQVYVGVNGSVKKAVVWVGNNGRKRCI